jgi:hypothetical protein
VRFLVLRILALGIERRPQQNDPGTALERNSRRARIARSVPFACNMRRVSQIDNKHVQKNEELAKRRKPKKPSKPKEPTNKPQARSLPVPVPASSTPLSVVNPDAPGIDVHSDMHMVCVPADRDVEPVRQFGANTADLQEIAAWLKKCGVKTVALESTGIYWIPLFELLES